MIRRTLALLCSLWFAGAAFAQGVPGAGAPMSPVQIIPNVINNQSIGIGIGANANQAGDVSLGWNALNNDGSGGYAIPGQNTAIGFSALPAPVSSYNTAVGWEAGNQYTGTASSHALSAFGAQAGATVTTGPDNSAFGASALFSTDGTGLTTGSNNLAVGVHTLTHLTSGSFNVAIGNESMVGCGNWTGFPACLLTGSSNTGIGQYTLQNIQGAATENTAVGFSGGGLVTTGAENTFLGSSTGSHIANSDTAITGSQNILIGRDIRLPTGATSNYLNIGNLITATGLTQGGAAANGALTINGSIVGGTWTATAIAHAYGGTDGTASTAFTTMASATEADVKNSNSSFVAKFTTSVSTGAASTYPVLQAGGGSTAQIYPGGLGSILQIGITGTTINLVGTTLQANGTTGVTCAGLPSALFASTNGLVTHC